MVHTITNPNREHITACIAINAAGGALPVYYIFKGQRRTPALLNALDKDQFSMTESGFVTKMAWKDWVRFYLSNISPPEKRNWVLLILDGFGCHGNDPETLELLEKNKVYEPSIFLENRLIHCKYFFR